MSKTTAMHAIRIDSTLRHAAESVFTGSEALSRFVEEAIRIKMERRQIQDKHLKTNSHFTR